MELQSKDIDATLKYGQIFASKTLYRVFISQYVLIGIVFIILLTMLIGVPITMAEFDKSMIVAIICCGSASVFLLIMLILVHRYCLVGKNKVDMYLKDAIILKATTSSNGECQMLRGLMIRKAVGIRVEFIYNGSNRTMLSEYRGKPLLLPVYMKYINKPLNIAYSPKYDDVMLIKDRCISK